MFNLLPKIESIFLGKKDNSKKLVVNFVYFNDCYKVK